MLSLYEILKASKTGIASDMWTALAGKNWNGTDTGYEVKELTGIPPLSIRSNGTILLDYLISGNMSQTGTPTPTTPIQPSECGDLETEGAHAGQYKIPISSANTTTPVYLGEVESTRKIRKYEFTGEENISDIGDDYYNTNVSVLSIAWSTTISTTGGFQINNGGNRIWAIKSYFSSYATATDFKTYLQQQYAAGTPVTVWYVLAEPTTGVVNEPLRKIGDYADTLSYEQAGVQIPTNRGNTVIDVLTELKPSQMYIKYQE